MTASCRRRTWRRTSPPARASARASSIQRSGRALLGLVGPPGAGKSTLAAALQAEFAGRRAGGADGRLPPGQRRTRAPGPRAAARARPTPSTRAATSRCCGACARRRDDEIVYAPEFRREIEEPIASAIPVFAAHAAGHHRRQLPAARRRPVGAGRAGCSTRSGTSTSTTRCASIGSRSATSSSAAAPRTRAAWVAQHRRAECAPDRGVAGAGVVRVPLG